jgi:dimethylargininase
MLHSEGDRLKKVVVCQPRREYFSIRDLAAQNMNEIPDPQSTALQFSRLENLMENAGGIVIRLEELKGHPNSVFTRDAALCTPMGYIHLCMGLPARWGEDSWLASHLDAMGEPCAGRIQPPGTVEGGDVILAGDVAFVGCSRRTNAEGARQLKEILEDMAYEVRFHEVPPQSLHLGGVMSVIGPNYVLSCGGSFPDGFFDGFDRIHIPGGEGTSGNVITLGPGEVIANGAENGVAVDALDKAGVKVHALDLSEFRKGGGGPSCLILPIERI